MFYILIILFTLLDLLSKKIASLFIAKEVFILWDILTLRLSKNTWIAFSLPITWIFLKLLTVVLIIWITYYYFEKEKYKENNLVKTWYWLIIWWAIGNWIERIFVWNVTDFINIKYFAICNLWDIFITIWVIILLFYYYKNEPRK